MSWVNTRFVGPGEQRAFDVILEAGTSSVIYVRPKEDVGVDLECIETNGMSEPWPDLVVLGFPTKEKAEAVLTMGGQLVKEELLDLEDAALVWRTATG